MGLDMYLSKAKRINDANIKEIVNINCYLQWKEEDNEYSLLEWCGVKEEKINKDLLPLYESEFNTRYYSWDDEKNMVERVLYLILQTGGRQIKFTDGSLKMYKMEMTIVKFMKCLKNNWKNYLHYVRLFWRIQN